MQLVQAGMSVKNSGHYIFSQEYQNFNMVLGSVAGFKCENLTMSINHSLQILLIMLLSISELTSSLSFDKTMQIVSTSKLWNEGELLIFMKCFGHGIHQYVAKLHSSSFAKVKSSQGGLERFSANTCVWSAVLQIYKITSILYCRQTVRLYETHF